MVIKMNNASLEQISEMFSTIKQELDEIKGYLEEDNLDLSAGTKRKIEESRKRSLSEMKSQEEIERKFL